MRAAGRDAAAVPEQQSRDQTSSGNQGHRLELAGADGAGAEAGILSLSVKVCAKEVGPKGN